MTACYALLSEAVFTSHKWSTRHSSAVLGLNLSLGVEDHVDRGLGQECGLAASVVILFVIDVNRRTVLGGGYCCRMRL